MIRITTLSVRVCVIPRIRGGPYLLSQLDAAMHEIQMCALQSGARRSSLSKVRGRVVFDMWEGGEEGEVGRHYECLSLGRSNLSVFSLVFRGFAEVGWQASERGRRDGELDGDSKM